MVWFQVDNHKPHLILCLNLEENQRLDLSQASSRISSHLSGNFNLCHRTRSLPAPHIHETIEVFSYRRGTLPQVFQLRSQNTARYSVDQNILVKPYPKFPLVL